MDVVEKLNMTVSESGNVIKSEVLGTLQMNTQLTGMPELKLGNEFNVSILTYLGLNDQALFEMQGKSTLNTVNLEDIKFHNCVRLNRFESDRSISFIPPDGEFELMTYRIDMEVKPLFFIDIQPRLTDTKLEMDVTVSCAVLTKFLTPCR
jgi:AP-1 complex subunit mu